MVIPCALFVFKREILQQARDPIEILLWRRSNRNPLQEEIK